MNAEAQEPRRRRRLRGPLVLAATFLLGALSGLGVAPLLRPPPGGLPPALESLHLSAGQRSRVEAIIARHGPEVEATLADAMPNLRALQERVALEIEAELDDDQRARFRRERANKLAPLPPR